jgi:hypothetical protein
VQYFINTSIASTVNNLSSVVKRKLVVQYKKFKKNRPPHLHFKKRLMRNRGFFLLGLNTSQQEIGRNRF